MSSNSPSSHSDNIVYRQRKLTQPSKLSHMLRQYLHSLPHWLINSVTASRIDEESTAQECPSRNPHTGFERYTRGRGLSRWDSHRVHVHVLLRGCRINEGD